MGVCFGTSGRIGSSLAAIRQTGRYEQHGKRRKRWAPRCSGALADLATELPARPTRVAGRVDAVQLVGRAGGMAVRRQRPRVPGARGRRPLAELRDVGPDLQTGRLAADVRATWMRAWGELEWRCCPRCSRRTGSEWAGQLGRLPGARSERPGVSGARRGRGVADLRGLGADRGVLRVAADVRHIRTLSDSVPPPWRLG